MTGRPEGLRHRIFNFAAGGPGRGVSVGEGLHCRPGGLVLTALLAILAVWLPASLAAPGATPEVAPPRFLAVPGAAFELAATEVSVAQYGACVAAGACTPAHTDDGRCWVHDGQTWRPGTLPTELRAPAMPQTCVSWTQARAYAAWVGGRLPSEAEWERAARAGTEQPFAGADDVAGLCAVANLSDRSALERVPHWTAVACDDGHPGPAPVGSLRPNAWGFHDLSGNVAEWTEDRWQPPAPTTAATLAYVTKGGAWSEGPAALRVDARFWDEPHLAYDNLGIRVARDVSEPPELSEPVDGAAR